MAIIYGRAQTEKELLDIAPNIVKKVEDIEIIHQKLKNKLGEEKKDFFDKVPTKILEEENTLEKIKNDEKVTHQKYDEKIKTLENKKAQGGFSTISAPLKISFLKNFSKRIEINKIKKLEKKQHAQLTEWKENPEQIFNRNKKEKINQIKTFAEIEKSHIHVGAKGELRVLDKLSQLGNKYHILCGLNIGLGHYVTYNGQKNLRSAQMDFVVVSNKGVILLEVKNWSSKFYRESNKISPHEQVDRAGRVLWITLNSWLSPSPRVTSVLLSIQDNMKYDPRFKFVLVSNLEKINYFIENRKEEFSDNDVETIVDVLKDFVTE